MKGGDTYQSTIVRNVLYASQSTTFAGLQQFRKVRVPIRSLNCLLCTSDEFQSKKAHASPLTNVLKYILKLKVRLWSRMRHFPEK